MKKMKLFLMLFFVIAHNFCMSQSFQDLDDLSNDIKFHLDMYEQVAQQQYADKQTQASEKSKASWWNSLQSSGTNALNSVAPSMIKESNTMFNQAVSSVNDMSKSIFDSLTMKDAIRKKYPVDRSFDGLQVRASKGLCNQEVSFLKNRMPKVIKALHDNFDIDSPLKIALCTSGGGNRAMLVSLGFMLGSQDIGLFDTYLYTVGVSGSTWTIAPWSYLNATIGMSLTDFKNNLVGNHILEKTMVGAGGFLMPPMPDIKQQSIIAANTAKHFAYDQDLSLIDLYGGIIGNYTLLPVGDDRLNVTWSSIAKTIENGNIPLPMGAAVSYKKNQITDDKTDYYWFEVGPFEVGSDQLGAYVPTWAFGSKFAHGKPVDGYQGKAPEYPISFYQGVFGSAFAASMNEIVDRISLDTTITILGQQVAVPVGAWIESSMSKNDRDSRIYPAIFHNYTSGLKTSPISSVDEISLYDAGMSIDFAVPLMMRPAREIDLIVVCDAAVDLYSLQASQLHCQRNGLKFPDISRYTTEIIGSKLMTILNDPSSKDYDATMVTVLYCPFIKNDGYSSDFDPAVCEANGECSALNFKYTDSQAARFVDLTRYNVNAMKNEIKVVLKKLQERKLDKI